MKAERQLSVLLVEDNAGDARLIRELLRDTPEMQLTCVETLAAALARLARPGVDLVLLDLGLPDSQGLNTASQVSRERPALPVIVLTGRDDDALAHAALTVGAQDYLVKGTIEVGMLVRAIRYAYERKQAEVALREAHEFTNQIVHSVQEGIVVYDRELRCKVWNPYMERLTGVSATKVVGHGPMDVYPFSREVGVADALQRALGGEVVSLPEIPYRAPKNEDQAWVTATFGPLRDVAGTIIGVIASLRDITLRKEAEDLLRSLSTRDDLTSLHNRRGFMTLGPQYLRMADRNRQAVLLLFADLDGLKVINDTQGHRAGDRALRDIATIFQRTFRASDILARLGGDEFAVLAMETPMTSADRLKARLHRSLYAHNAKALLPLSLSIGIARYDPEHQCSLEELLAQADAAMYEQKREKRKQQVPVD
ncbi:MAG TPA: diguanylate cyclase [Candidatus Methylomirabilis sp.]|nr:diguanylate cyclase [Candidatus Methylomirabilis sp.]